MKVVLPVFILILCTAYTYASVSDSLNTDLKNKKTTDAKKLDQSSGIESKNGMNETAVDHHTLSNTGINNIRSREHTKGNELETLEKSLGLTTKERKNKDVPRAKAAAAAGGKGGLNKRNIGIALITLGVFILVFTIVSAISQSQ